MVYFVNGIPITAPNSIVKDNKEEKYYISYNPSIRDYGTKTTALVINKDNKKELFYILKGDHSKQYANCKDLKECINYFISNKKYIHEFSDEFEHGYMLDAK